MKFTAAVVAAASVAHAAYQPPSYGAPTGAPVQPPTYEQPTLAPVQSYQAPSSSVEPTHAPATYEKPTHAPATYEQPTLAPTSTPETTAIVEPTHAPATYEQPTHAVVTSSCPVIYSTVYNTEAIYSTEAVTYEQPTAAPVSVYSSVEPVQVPSQTYASPPTLAPVNNFTTPAFSPATSAVMPTNALPTYPGSASNMQGSVLGAAAAALVAALW